MLYLSIFIFGLGIPTAYYGYKNENSSCQMGDRGGINLSDWVKGLGLSSVILTAWIWFMILFTYLSQNYILITTSIVITIFDMFFFIIWWIWGIVLLSTDQNRTCLAEGNDMATMAVINIIFSEFRLGYFVLLIQLVNS